MSVLCLGEKLVCCGLLAGMLLVSALPVAAGQTRADMTKKVGDRAPLFTLATSQDTLVDYQRDYYGKHHLILSFFPAAFTPV